MHIVLCILPELTSVEVCHSVQNQAAQTAQDYDMGGEEDPPNQHGWAKLVPLPYL